MANIFNFSLRTSLKKHNALTLNDMREKSSLYSSRHKYVSELTNTRLISNIERFLSAGSTSGVLSPAEFGQLYIKAKISAKQLRVNSSNGDDDSLNAKTSEIFAFIDQQITGNFASIKSGNAAKLKEVLYQLRAAVNN